MNFFFHSYMINFQSNKLTSIRQHSLCTSPHEIQNSLTPHGFLRSKGRAMCFSIKIQNGALKCKQRNLELRKSYLYSKKIDFLG